MPDEVVGAASITINPDLTGFDTALEAGVQEAADRAAASIVAAFSGAAADASAELAQIGTAGFVDVTQGADAAAAGVGGAFEGAAAEADAALGSIGAGAAEQITGEFAGTGEAIADGLTAGADAANTSLEGIGAGAGTAIVDEFSGVADAIAQDIATGAEEANAALDALGANPAGAEVASGFEAAGASIGGGVQAGTDEAVAGLDTLDTAATGIVEGLAERFEGLGGAIALALGGFAIGSFISAGERVNSILATTDQLIESTGGSANVTDDQILALGDSLERVTNVESEVAQEAANVLLIFRNVRNEMGEGNDIFDRTISLGADLSAVLGGDIVGATQRLGRALEDPITGMQLLRRAGVVFTADQKELVRSLVEQGDVLGAQRVILDEVAAKVGGAAEASAKATTIIGNSLGNITEAVGVGLVSALDDLAARTPALVDEFAPRAEEFGEALGKATEVAVDGLLALAPVLGTTTDLALALLPVLEVGVSLIDAIPDPVLQAAAALLVANRALKLFGGAGGLAFSAVSRLALPGNTVADAMNNVGTAGPRGAAGLRSLAQGATGVTAAVGLGLTALSMYSDAINSASERGHEFGQGVRDDFDLAALSAEELANLSNVLGTEIENLRDQQKGGLSGFTIDRDFNAEIRGGADELEAFREEVEATRREVALLQAQTAFGARADSVLDIASALDIVGAESGEVESALRSLRLTGDESDETFLNLAFTLDAAALSEEAMAAAAQTLGVDVADLKTFVEATTGAVQVFIDTAVGGLPGIAEAFADANDDGKVSAREFIRGLQDEALGMAVFLGDLQTIVGAGFSEVAGVLAEQGAEAAGAATREIAQGITDGNLELVLRTQQGIDARDAVLGASTDFLTNTLGPEYVTATGAVATNATALFGENFDLQEQVRIAGELATSGLDAQSQQIAAVAVTSGDLAAREFGAALDMDEEAIDEAIAAGRAIRANAPTADARTAGNRTGEAFGDGLAAGMTNRQILVNDRAQQIVLQAEAAARRAARAKSPSELFADLGADMGDGIAKGIDDATAAVVREAEAIVAAAADAVSGSALLVGARLDPNVAAIANASAATASAVLTSGDSPATGAPAVAQAPIIIERMVLPTSNPDLAASALIGGLVTIAQTVGNR